MSLTNEPSAQANKARWATARWLTVASETFASGDIADAMDALSRALESAIESEDFDAAELDRAASTLHELRDIVDHVKTAVEHNLSWLKHLSREPKAAG